MKAKQKIIYGMIGVLAITTFAGCEIEGRSPRGSYGGYEQGYGHGEGRGERNWDREGDHGRDWDWNHHRD